MFSRSARRFSGRGAPLRQSGGAAESHRAPEPGGPCRLRAAKTYRRRAAWDAWDGREGTKDITETIGKP